MKEAPALSICRHTNEENPSIEHVQLLHWACANILMRETSTEQMLHWACADILMRENPVTDKTDNILKTQTQTDLVYTHNPPCNPLIIHR